ncbi:NAD(P)/FAD-dependent oxidoreductase [Sandaracinobacter sp. RS1-74]|uniref:NAD(P)/FAD-dependent oxidoreductase n=1 Tax=Sandaracinobacteroides sayramensis TaxID=2913411 RepID=UPI001EDBF30F|nr:NAD(P)/FAD-dependent oxidoreductase [Sandaracinobacteroides sayramensis]MCG2841004.1 NAD(P)/FAD-dependent oxidoreductase [Sandaracinobacteroides sayramensis]
MRPRIVIVGAGFGGMAAVRALKGAAADITLVDQTNHHLFQPLLYQVATAALSPADIATASRVLTRGQPEVRVLMAEAVGVDPKEKLLRLADGDPLPFDHLVLATGAAYSFFGHDEWAEHAQVLKSLDDALAIRERLLFAFEKAERTDDPQEVRRLLTFVVVGGGPTGVEMAGTIAELALTTLARDFRRIDPKSARILLCEAGQHVLGAFPADLPAYATEALRSLGVEVRLGQAVSLVDSAGIVLGEERIDAANVLWCAGTQARPAARWLAADAARNGAVRVRPDCSVPGHPDIFAIGDVSSFEAGDGRPLPGLAPVAKQQGKYVGKLLAARIAGRAAPPPFRYRDMGTMAVIGRSRAIADFGRFQMRGFLAWLAWSLVHLMLLVDFRSRVMVYTNWSWAWFTYGRGARLLTGKGRKDSARKDG